MITLILKLVIQHAIKWLKNKKIYAEFVCCVYPTSVFFSAVDILEGYKKIKSHKWDFVFTAGKSSRSAYHSFEKKSGFIKLLYPSKLKKRSQKIETFNDAGHFYWAKPDIWLSNKRLFQKIISNNYFKI